jgi:glycosyltransferase involved in cell wall biosynthesis
VSYRSVRRAPASGGMPSVRPAITIRAPLAQRGCTCTGSLAITAALAEVSIVVAAYNQAPLLAQAIDSVRAQTFADWELVVVDDGSTDDTPEVVARRADDPRIVYVRQARAERCVARNRGIAASTGRLVAFLDADDLWRPEKLARQVAALAAEPAAGLCYTIARFVDAAGRPLPIRKPARPLAGDAFACLMRGNVLILASVVVRRACLDEAGGFDPALARYGCEDWDLWLGIARRHPVAVVDEELTLYRRHDANTGWERVLAGALMVVDRWYADAETAARAGVSHRTVRALQLWLNAASLAGENRAAAARLAARALRESPASALGRSALATAAGLALPRALVAPLRRR